jgi:hypothetical protein
MLDAEYFSCTWQLEMNLSSSNQTLFILEDLSYVFKYCPQLTHLEINMSDPSLGMELEKFTNFDWELRQGFQKLKSVQFVNCLGRLFYNSWPIYQVVLT